MERISDCCKKYASKKGRELRPSKNYISLIIKLGFLL